MGVYGVDPFAQNVRRHDLGWLSLLLYRHAFCSEIVALIEADTKHRRIHDGSPAGQEFIEVIIYTRHPEVWLPLKRLPEIPWGRALAVDLHNRQDKIIRLVQRRPDLAGSDRDRTGTDNAPLHLDKPQPAGVGDRRLTS